LFVQIVPIAMQQQAVEAGRARDKGRVADVANGLPASSQVQRCCSLCDFSCCALEVDCLLQAVLRAFAHRLAMGSASGDDSGGLQLKERFELFLSVTCDAFWGRDSVRGREAKHSRRFLRMAMRYVYADVRVRAEDGEDGAPGGHALCEDAAVSIASPGQAGIGQSADHDHVVDVRGNSEMRLSDVEEGRAVNEDSVASIAQVGSSGRMENDGCDEDAPAYEALYLGVALEEQCLCEWSGLRIPAVLGGMLMALSTPVDVIIEALSSADACDCDTAAVAFAELESLCTGHAGDADTVCGAIVSKRSVHGAGLDIGLLRLWLRKLPVAVSCGCARFSLFVDCVCVCGRMAPRFV
jgi:hypothetical protein